MALTLLYLAIGFVFLIIGADLLVRGSSAIAKRFHIPDIVIGLTIVCIGTSMPEIVITISSAFKNYTELIVGNAIGSNLCNLMLILGVVSFLRPVKIEKEIQKVHIPISIFSTFFLLLIGNGLLGTEKFVITRLDGAILLILFIIYFSYPIVLAIRDIKKNKQQLQKKDKNNLSVITSCIFIIAGIVLLKYGGDFVVDNSVTIAHRFGISEQVIGLTIVAIGTAMPELITSIIAAIKKDTNLAIGNLIGSCMLNLLLILGLGAVITPLSFEPTFNFSMILLLITCCAILIFNYVGKKRTITRLEGVSLIVAFIFYIVHLVITG